MTRIIHVGALPPPIGGVTIHVRRTVTSLRRLGHDVIVVNPRPRAANTEVVTGIGAIRTLVQNRRREAPVFVHYSSSPSVRGSLNLLILSLFIGRRSLALVQHSGSFPKDVIAGGLGPRLQRRLVGRARLVICFSTSIEHAVATVSSSTVTVRGSSFVADDELREASVMQEPQPFVAPTVVVSGYRTPVYRFGEVIDAWKAVREDLETLELHIYSYGDTDDEYWEPIASQVESLDGVRLFVDANSESFLSALRSASAYVRNTSHDSYGVAVAEALFLGTPALATSVCERPIGTMLYDVGDTTALARLLAEAVRADRVAHVEPLDDGTSAYVEALMHFASVAS